MNTPIRYTIKMAMEIQSNYIKLSNVQKLIAAQETRLSRFDLLKNEKEELLKLLDVQKKKLSADLAHDEHELNVTEKTLTNFKINLDHFKSNQITDSTSKQQLQLEETISHLTQKSISYLDELDQVETAEKEIHQFLKGLEKSKLDLSSEIQNEINQLKTNEASIKEMINNEMKGLAEVESTLIKQAIKKHGMENFTAKISAGSCEKCQMKIPRTNLDAIEARMEWHRCNLCGRVLVP